MSSSGKADPVEIGAPSGKGIMWVPAALACSPSTVQSGSLALTRRLRRFVLYECSSAVEGVAGGGGCLDGQQPTDAGLSQHENVEHFGYRAMPPRVQQFSARRPPELVPNQSAHCFYMYRHIASAREPWSSSAVVPLGTDGYTPSYAASQAHGPGAAKHSASAALALVCPTLSHGPISWSLQGDKDHLPSNPAPQVYGAPAFLPACLPACLPAANLCKPHPCWQKSTCNLQPACDLRPANYGLRPYHHLPNLGTIYQPPVSFSQAGSLYRRSLLSAGVVTGPLKTCVPTSPAHHHQTKTQRSDEPFGSKQPIGSIALVLLTLYRGPLSSTLPFLSSSILPTPADACFPRGALKVADPSILE
ncbi:hypothetical protein DHEL01_v210245 [Diaporthe helianthi]|uniref:Uncharacterized protein n=1 Tax=Diaporthe helianthi TaxID=158607 RepID=A0A2P5HM88_DIAHE|nr:hypothetical protein DHEL01_v210245 [Diaporthe helianthi]